MRAVLLLGLLATSGAVACGVGGESGSGPPAGSPPAAAAPAGSTPAVAGAKTHDIRGRIDAISAARSTVTLDHEAIPGLMDAMKMEYQVQEPSVLDGLSVGDHVQGQIEVRPGDQYVVVRLRK